MVLGSPDFRFHSELQILAHGRDIAKRIAPDLPGLFKILPRMPYGVRAIPTDRANRGPQLISRLPWMDLAPGSSTCAQSILKPSHVAAWRP